MPTTPFPWRETVAAHISVYALTPREADIAWRIFQGPGGPEIAAALGISQQTVRNTITNLNRKLGTSDRLEVALVLLGILPPRYGQERRRSRSEPPRT